MRTASTKVLLYAHTTVLLKMELIFSSVTLTNLSAIRYHNDIVSMQHNDMRKSTRTATLHLPSSFGAVFSSTSSSRRAPRAVDDDPESELGNKLEPKSKSMDNSSFSALIASSRLVISVRMSVRAALLVLDKTSELGLALVEVLAECPQGSLSCDHALLRAPKV